MMVDNSIVVLENIFRRRDEQGEDMAEAAVAGASEVGSAIVASTVTTLVIFLPLAFVRGVSAVLFQDLAVVIVFALACSLLVSLSLVPMLASKLLRLPGPSGGVVGGAGARSAKGSEGTAGLYEGYGALLRGALRHRLFTIMFAAAALAASLLLVPAIGTEFLPPSDEGEVRVSGEMAVGTRLGVVDRQTRALEAAVYPAVPEATSSVVSVGASGRNPQDAFRGEIRLTLQTVAERTRSNTEIAPWCAQYESLRDPLVVMLSVPVAAIGVLVTLVLTHTTLNVQSFIGCIMLGGIVVNNAILLVDQARRLRPQGFSVTEAVVEAGRRRLRPILMTTLTTVLALLPLAMGVGEGADAQAPLARAVLGGLAASTLITLVLVPVVFSLAQRR